MKKHILIAAQIGLLAGMSFSLQAADQKTKLHAKPGSKVRIEGTSSIHDWQVEGKLIGGSIEVDSNFPTKPGQEVKPGKVAVNGEAAITVRSLSSVTKSGAHYDDKMDDTMWEKLKVNEHPKIFFRPSELELKEAAKSKDAPYEYSAQGELVVAGVTNKVTMPVKVLPMENGNVKISGSTPSKMSDFKIPVEKIGLGLIKTGDEIKLLFDWVVGPPKAATAAAK